MAYADPPDPAPRFGFAAYADGTPRVGVFPPPPPAYGNGYDETDFEDDAATPFPGLPRAGLRIAAFAALTLAAAAAAFAAPVLIPLDPKPASLAAATPARVMPPAPAIAAPLPAPPPATVAAKAAPAASPDRLAPPRGKTAEARSRRTRNSFAAPMDCTRPISRAQSMVCGSPELRAQDRRMARAYAEARAHGAPPRALRHDQRRWVTARDIAARRSTGAVERLYRERTDDLEARPYRATVAHAAHRAAAANAPRRWGFHRLAHWLRAVPRKIYRDEDEGS